MFIVTAKISKRKAAALLACACVLAAVCIIVVSSVKKNVSDAAAMPRAQTIDVSYKNVKDNDARVNFLKTFNWDVVREPVAIEEVTIPKEFDATYTEYNELQKRQGLDLLKYRGKTIRRYTYEITNYPDYEEVVYGNILIYKNRVIGGDVCSSEFRGFMHGFKMP